MNSMRRSFKSPPVRIPHRHPTVSRNRYEAASSPKLIPKTPRFSGRHVPLTLRP